MKLSIITINLNNRNGLQNTISSVIQQTWRNFEYIVIDGGSTDGSKELIQRFSSDIHYWISEPDSGIYNAMNKGARAAKGDYLLFLNSGDTLFNVDTLFEIQRHTLKSPLVYGTIKHCIPPNTLHDQSYPHPNELDFPFFYNNSLPHPAMLIERSFFHSMGGYREDLKIISDWAFCLKSIFMENVKAQQIPTTIAIHFRDGISSQPKNLPTIRLEQTIVFTDYFPDQLNHFSKSIRFAQQNSWWKRILQRIKRR